MVVIAFTAAIVCLAYNSRRMWHQEAEVADCM